MLSLLKIVGEYFAPYFVGKKMETTYYITEYYKIHNPERLSGIHLSTLVIIRCSKPYQEVP